MLLYFPALSTHSVAWVSRGFIPYVDSLFLFPVRHFSTQCPSICMFPASVPEEQNIFLRFENIQTEFPIYKGLPYSFSLSFKYGFGVVHARARNSPTSKTAKPFVVDPNQEATAEWQRWFFFSTQRMQRERMNLRKKKCADSKSFIVNRILHFQNRVSY